MLASPLTNPSPTNYFPLVAVDGGAKSLEDCECAEVMAFLGQRPVYTAFLTGLICDNGLQSPLNRGTFYGYRNLAGEIEGVALIGHATIIEATTDQAVRAFAKTTQQCKAVHLIMCEESRLDQFWSYYAVAGQEMRQARRQFLLELRWPIQVPQPEPDLRLATVEDLELLVPVHADMALEESGTDPRQQDGEGFVKRYVRRIKQGRTWIVTEKGQLQFKAEVVAETPETSYIEGVWVNPAARRQGYGRRCMSQLARTLLWRTKSVCLFVNDENEDARRFYRQGGYHMRAVYDTIFLK